MTKNIVNIDTIARELATANGITIKLAKELVKNTFNIVANSMSVNNEIYINDFGTFKVNTRQCRQPMTDNKMTANVITFKAFKNLKAQVK